MNEIQLTEIRNSQSMFDSNGSLLMEINRTNGARFGQKIYAPTSIIQISKNLDVYIEPSFIYTNIMSSKGFLEVELSPIFKYQLKHQHTLIEMVSSFNDFHRLHIGVQYFIKRTGKNSISSIPVNVENLRATGPKNVSKLNVLFNTAMLGEEYELAGIVNRTIKNMLSSKYTVGVPSNKNYFASLKK